MQIMTEKPVTHNASAIKVEFLDDLVADKS